MPPYALIPRVSVSRYRICRIDGPLFLPARHFGCPAAQTAEDQPGEQQDPTHDPRVGPIQGVGNGKNAKDGTDHEDAEPNSIHVPHRTASLVPPPVRLEPMKPVVHFCRGSSY